MSHILFIAGLVKYYTLHAILTFSQHVLQHLPYLCHKNPNHYDIPRILCQKHHSGHALDTQLLYSETDLQVPSLQELMALRGEMEKVSLFHGPHGSLQ